MRSLVRVGRSLGRASRRGFTLIELMVVVILVAILSMLAIPAMSKSRNDQIAFDYARKLQLIMNRARVRANAGSAQLVVGDLSGRGKFWLFEGKDETSCIKPNLWNDAPGWPDGQVETAALRLVDWLDLNNAANGIVITDDIRAATFPASPAFAYCVSPAGRVVVGKGGSVAGAIADMQALTSQPTWTFTDVLDIRISRQGTLAVRSVVLAGGSSARILTR